MGFIKKALDKPRTLFLRRALFQIHLWAGIAIGIYALLIGISGSILVFREDLQEMRLHPYETVTVPAGSARQSPDAWLAVLRRELGPRGQMTIELPQKPEDPVHAFLFREGGMHHYFLNPYTSEVMGQVSFKGGFLAFLHTFHGNLFLMRPGRLVNGYGALLLLLLIVTGAFIWWPGRRLWRRRMGIDFSASGKRINWDLHNATGFWSLSGFALLCLTGAFFTWPQFFRDAIGKRWPLSPPAQVKPVIMAGAPAASMESIIAAADKALPEKPSWRVQYPPNNREVVRVWKLGPGMPEHRTATQIWVHPQTAEVLRVDRFENRTTGDKIAGWIAPLHIGNFGGLPVRIVYAILGVVPGLLFITGFIMWWDRVVRKRWRSWKTAPNEEKETIAAA
ncbi:MAG: PepSY domain-containing protein [Acidobacteria bacterium]|nr:PepSY domain-containing protein [Acidobacteriota bacterium]